MTLDGVDVRELDLAQLRSSLALVLQDVHLFSGTIASNIRLGSAISDERVRAAAARRARAPLHRGAAEGLRHRGARSAGATLSVGPEAAPVASRARWPTTRAC